MFRWVFPIIGLNQYDFKSSLNHVKPFLFFLMALPGTDNGGFRMFDQIKTPHLFHLKIIKKNQFSPRVLKISTLNYLCAFIHNYSAFSLQHSAFSLLPSALSLNQAFEERLLQKLLFVSMEVLTITFSFPLHPIVWYCENDNLPLLKHQSLLPKNTGYNLNFCDLQEPDRNRPYLQPLSFLPGYIKFHIVFHHAGSLLL